MIDLKAWGIISAATLGTAFVVTLLILAIYFPRPTPFQYTVFRIILSLSAAGVAAIIPGFIEVHMKQFIQAGGAMAVFVIVYFFSPAQLLLEQQDKDKREPRTDTISEFSIMPPSKKGDNSLKKVSGDKLFEIQKVQDLDNNQTKLSLLYQDRTPVREESYIILPGMEGRKTDAEGHFMFPKTTISQWDFTIKIANKEKRFILDSGYEYKIYFKKE